MACPVQYDAALNNEGRVTAADDNFVADCNLGGQVLTKSFGYT